VMKPPPRAAGDSTHRFAPTPAARLGSVHSRVKIWVSGGLMFTLICEISSPTFRPLTASHTVQGRGSLMRRGPALTLWRATSESLA